MVEPELALVLFIPIGGIILGAMAVTAIFKLGVSAVSAAKSALTESAKKQAHEEEKRCREEAEHAINEVWRYTRDTLTAEASEITNPHEREKIITSITESESLYKNALADGDSSLAEQIVSSIREKIFTVHTDELILKAAAHKRNDRAIEISLDGLEEDRVFFLQCKTNLLKPLQRIQTPNCWKIYAISE